MCVCDSVTRGIECNGIIYFHLIALHSASLVAEDGI